VKQVRRVPEVNMTPEDYIAKDVVYPLKTERIERTCLKCERRFLARGRFNRICPTCRRVNKESDLDWFGVEARGLGVD
jgi:Zn finger protein HypA/HybF involved in hydrogenase expression